jgi:hypothetical protein
MSFSDADSGELIPLSTAIQNEIPGNPSYSTAWRWIFRGLAPATPGEPRIKLAVVYVGSKPFTSRAFIKDFIARSTQARFARMASAQDAAADVTDDELAAAGLLKPAGRRGRPSKQVSE